MSLDQVSHSIKHLIYVVDDSGSSTGALTRGDRGEGDEDANLAFLCCQFFLKETLNIQRKIVCVCVGGCCVGGWERQCSVNTNGAFTDRDQDR